jgi:hypothetical protein
MHTSFFSEWNLGFFRGMVKVGRQLGDIVAVQYNSGGPSNCCKSEGPVPACIKNSPLKVRKLGQAMSHPELLFSTNIDPLPRVAQEYFEQLQY